MAKKAKYLITLLIVSCLNLFSQNLDSLELALKTSKHDTTSCKILNELIEAEADAEIWPVYNSQLQKLSQTKAKDAQGDLRNFYLKYLAISLNNLGYLATIKGNIGDALNYNHESLKIAEQINDKNSISNSYNNLGSIYKNQGDIPKALEYYHKSLEIQEQFGDKKGMAYSVINIGLIYNDQGDFKKALDQYTLSLKLSEEINDKLMIATALNNLGGFYNNIGNTDKALHYFEQGLKIRLEIGDRQGIANSYNNIGFIKENKGDYVSASENYLNSLNLFEEMGDKQGTAHSLNNLGRVKLYQSHLLSSKIDKQKNYLLARSYAQRSLNLSMQLGFPENIRNSVGTLAKIDSSLGDPKGAFENYKLYILYRDSISNETNRKASMKNQLRYEYEKKEAVIKEQQEKERAVAEEKSRFQQIVIAAVIIGLLLVIVFAAFVFRSLKTTRKQKHIIEEKQREILDSIHYAKRIQTALMTNENYIVKNLKRLQKD